MSKLSKSIDESPSSDFLLGGRLEMRNLTMKSLIVGAYNVPDNMVTGAPNWASSDHFDIIAKAQAGTPPETLMLMLQKLLAERFKLSIHREDKVIAVYALVVDKSGPKLRQAEGSGQRNSCSSRTVDGQIRRTCRNITMADLATRLPKFGGQADMDRPVVDLTELKGTYDLELEWTFRRPGDNNQRGDSADRTIFNAVAQLGLKLEARRLPMPMVVIDHVERIPTGN